MVASIRTDLSFAMLAKVVMCSTFYVQFGCNAAVDTHLKDRKAREHLDQAMNIMNISSHNESLIFT